MAYPYMNGTLHAGHSLTISKVEFAAGFARMQGKRVLFPMGFHFTGMAVKGCADKLTNEVAMFGSGYINDTTKESPLTSKPAITIHEDVTKFTSKKGKSAAKTVKMTYQFQIMQSLNIPHEDIHKFADAQRWFQFFPPLCQRDLSSFGARIDWRRSMGTTDLNPYYDSFVRWQMNRLRQLNKIKFGTRYTIYSPKDKQPCMDHDRSEGEGVGPQEYTAIRLKVLSWASKAIEHLGEKLPTTASIYFVATTLRPETMYGQTCCFLSPSITYGVFKVSKDEFYVITDRSARNMALQGIFSQEGECEKVAELPESACIGTLVNAPLSVHKFGVRILPMDSISPIKGTGVVTSVPSDSPEDFITLQQLTKKPEYCGTMKEWAEFKMTSIIMTPSYGNLTAPFLVESLKISSSKDTKQLEQAKELVYKEEYYQGIIVYGDFKGDKVEDAKLKVRKQLFDLGLAFAYAEPERKVVSRSADECCVALMDQWYLDYGEETWKVLALEHVANSGGSGLQTYSSETKNAFKGVLDWLNQWACARSYGHGSKLPWDPKFMVESLSDSTIYMAYYTVAHYLHNDPYGKTEGLGRIRPEEMTDEVWDYIFARGELTQEASEACKIPRTTLDRMRREFEYWYPVDVNVSGKDLVPNHLTFFIYVHLAIWEKQKEFWPRSVRSNGHLTLNGEKMSKSTGNFMTLEQLVKKFGADASGIAIADAGDGVRDANLEEDVANNNVLRLYNLREWCQNQIANKSNLRSGIPDLFYDKLFSNEMDCLIRECYSHYEATNYKLALKSALYDLTSARDFYREGTTSAGIAMHRDLVFRYIEIQALLLAVIAPHWAEYIWLEVLGKASTIQNARFPTTPPIDYALSATYRYARAISSNITSAEAAQLRKRAKGKAPGLDSKQLKRLSIFVATEFPAWQDQYITLLKTFWNDRDKNLDEAKLMAEMKKAAGPDFKKAMAFVQGLKKRLLAGEHADLMFQRHLGFDELKTLEQMAAGLKKVAGLKELIIVEIDGAGNGVIYPEQQQVKDLPQSAKGSIPGVPTFQFEKHCIKNKYVYVCRQGPLKFVNSRRSHSPPSTTLYSRP
ncbi:leucyl-tRNA synthetase [Cadophora sp. DSE1049]|nr:leucyl-tRNA synthetase [Cadophora sp. DSE1049]